MKTVIHDGNLFLPERVLPQGWICIEDGIITKIGEGRPPTADHRVDAAGLHVSPGFIDMHVHGGGGHDFMDASPEAMRSAAQLHLEHGTTGIVPTTLTCADAELFDVMACYKEVKNDWDQGPDFLGLHLEGPYFAPSQAGAQDPAFLKNPDPNHYLPILAAGGEDIVRWSAAVELEGAFAFGDELKKRGILAAIGHCDADYPQVKASLAHGYSHLTHFYSTMSTIRRRGAYRHLGVVESAYLLDALSVEIIADGCHLPPELLELIVRNIPARRITLVTDAMRGAGLPDGSETIIGSLDHGQPALIQDGVAFMPGFEAFAGSVCTADRCVRTMHEKVGLSLPQAVALMTKNPAALLGLSQRKGQLRVGMDADLCLFDDKVKIQSVFVGGKLRHSA